LKDGAKEGFIVEMVNAGELADIGSVKTDIIDVHALKCMVNKQLNVMTYII